MSPMRFAAIAHAMEGNRELADTALPAAEAPLRGEPFERESGLLLAYAVAGRRSAVAALIRAFHGRDERVFWFFHRVEAVALTILEQWSEVERVLPPLEPIAAKGSPYLDVMASAIRDEINAARGSGLPAEHQQLRQLGYLGWSQLLSHRPGRP